MDKENSACPTHYAKVARKMAMEALMEGNIKGAKHFAAKSLKIQVEIAQKAIESLEAEQLGAETVCLTFDTRSPERER